MLFHMVGAFAEFERELIRERTRAVIEAAVRRGVRLGRHYAMSREDEAEALCLWHQGAMQEQPSHACLASTSAASSAQLSATKKSGRKARSKQHNDQGHISRVVLSGRKATSLAAWLAPSRPKMSASAWGRSSRPSRGCPASSLKLLLDVCRPAALCLFVEGRVSTEFVSGLWARVFSRRERRHEKWRIRHVFVISNLNPSGFKFETEIGFDPLESPRNSLFVGGCARWPTFCSLLRSLP